jgi:uncharacterized protein (TIGR02302 family)
LVSSSDTDGPDGQRAARRGDEVLSQALSRARWAILWERLWPALASLATAAGLFLAVSWLGLWLWLPPVGRAAGLAVFFVLAVAAAIPMAFVRMPTPLEALRRLDRASRLPHRPATAIADDMATATGDAISVALWRAHVERALRAARDLRAGPPMPRLAGRDPYALRALVLILAVCTFVAAGNDRFKRIAAAFDWQGVVTPANFRVDAWVTPPAYTGRAPQILPGLRPGEPVRPTMALSVPAGSTLVVRSAGQANLAIDISGGLVEIAGDARPQALAGTEERRFTVNESGRATVKGGGEALAWTFTAIADQPPTIALTKEPEPQARGGLQLTYKLEDDYGVAAAQATFARKPAAAAAPQDKPARPLYDAPDFALALPQARTRSGVGVTLKDVTEHPWAGVETVMTLVVRDDAGNEGRSSPQELRLPERPFSNPLARALIEQRRMLALDAGARERVAKALDALAIAPELFTPDAGVYLGLRSIYFNLARASGDDALRDVVARLWSMAVHIEDGNVSETEQALRAAQDALRQALDRNAPDDEIKRLADQLRAALDKFMQAMAEEMRKNPQMARPLDPNMRNLRPQDLNSMIDRMEQLSRSGAKDAAKKLLSELQQMLENLQMARPGGQQDAQDGDDMSQALNELGDMIRKQQQLRDRTFRRGQDQQRDQQRQQGQRGQNQQRQGDKNGFGELRQDQQALRDRLSKLLEEMRKRGLSQPGDPGQSGQEPGQGQQPGDQLGQADDAMGEAGGSLGEGNADGAVDSQGRALEAMRKGAQGMAEQMQQQMGQGPGSGPGGQPGRNGQARANQDTDPLGRPLRGRDYSDDSSVKVPGEIDVQRARRILEELRRRFGESFRPQLELDYIERLLKGF